MSQEKNQNKSEKKTAFLKWFGQVFTVDYLFWTVFVIAGVFVLSRDFRLLFYFVEDPAFIRKFFPKYFFYFFITLLLLISLRLKKTRLVENFLSNIYLRLTGLFLGFLFIAHYRGITEHFLRDLSENGTLIFIGLIFIAIIYLIWEKPIIVMRVLKSSYFWFWLFVWMSAFYLLFRPEIYFFVNSYWVYFFTGCLVLISIYAVWKIPLWLNSGLSKNDGKQLSAFELKEKELKLIDDSRKTVATIIGGLFVVVGAIFTYSNYQLAFEGQVTERFSKSVALLKESDVSVRIGGLYALERIAKDSPKDYPTIMETFAAYIREKSRESLTAFTKEKAEKLKKTYEEVEKDHVIQSEFAQRPSATDIVSALEIIGRRDAANDKGNYRLDLRGANAQGARLAETSFYRANFSRANLSEASFVLAKLEQANFREATLFKVEFNGAKLMSVHMNGAYLSEAHLQGADITHADLSGADLTRANLSNADLSSTNLSAIRGLTFEQLSVAIINEYTKLPDYLLERGDELLKISEKNREKRRKI